MQLLVSPTSPYARKCRVLARELDLMKSIEEVMTAPATDTRLRTVNPLGKIPALILDDGSALYDSPVICEYLDELGQGHFFPRASLFKAAQGKWKALTLQALGDGMCDAIVRRFTEARRPQSPEGDAVIAHQSRAIDTALDVLERAAPKFADHPTIGEVTAGCALDYMGLRLPGQDWRTGRPALAAWFEKFRQYPSMRATEPPAQ